MSYNQNFVELNKKVHDRVSFDCGEESLNSFIKTQALRHKKAGVSKTMVLPAHQPLENRKYPIVSFYTVAPSAIKRNSLPIKLAKKLPQYPIPVFLLAQLAVHQKYQKQGLGKVTLINALNFLWKINTHISAYAIIVDCLNKNVEDFYAKYGFQILYSQKDTTRMFIPMKTIEKLFK